MSPMDLPPLVAAGPIFLAKLSFYLRSEAPTGHTEQRGLK